MVSHRQIQLEDILSVGLFDVVEVRVEVVINSGRKFINWGDSISSHVLDKLAFETGIQSPVRAKPVAAEVTGQPPRFC